VGPLLVLSTLARTAPSSPRIYPLSLHDALPICVPLQRGERDRGAEQVEAEHRSVDQAQLRPGEPARPVPVPGRGQRAGQHGAEGDRKSTRLNSSHVKISYAVFCLKKKVVNQER